MNLSPEILQQARGALIEAAQQKVNLVAAIKEQGRKIFELEREVQKQQTGRVAAEEALTAARIELEAIRSQIPSDATVNAFQALSEYLSAPAEIHPQLRVAA
jgi:hypothetical protein